MPQHVGRHYTGTSCLCNCHFTSKGGCDDKVCIATGKSERKTMLAAERQPVVAQAAEPMTPIFTPFGATTRFGQ